MPSGAIPFVHYHCPCTVDRLPPPPDATPSAALLLTTPIPHPTSHALPAPPTAENVPDSLSKVRASPISQLYFCEDCHRLKCQQCTVSDIACYYCPNCLFEVPTASVKSERNRCMRNCFQCPVCMATLAVLAEESTLTTASGVTSTSVGRYYLACGSCRFDSRTLSSLDPETGTVLPHVSGSGLLPSSVWTFERPTGLASIAQKEDDARWDVKEFERLRDAMDVAMRKASEARMTGVKGGGRIGESDAGSIVDEFLRSAARSTAGGSTSGRLGGLVRQTSGLEGVAELDESNLGMGSSKHGYNPEARTVEELMNLTDADAIATLDQRFQQLSDQPYLLSDIRPQRIHLRAKRTRRCRSCRHVLIKPEQKAIATRFKISLLAIHYVPTVTIQEIPLVWRVGEMGRVVLKFANPVYFPMDVNVVAKMKEEDGETRMLAAAFQMGEYSDMWEYEEELASLGATSLAAAAARGRLPTDRTGRGADGSMLPPGIFEQKGNSTSVIVNITPKRPTEEKDVVGLSLDLWIKYSYVEVPEEDEFSDEENEDELSGSDVDGEGGVDPDQKRIEKEEREKRRMEEEGVVREYSFWVTVGLGRVVPSAPIAGSASSYKDEFIMLGM